MIAPAISAVTTSPAHGNQTDDGIPAEAHLRARHPECLVQDTLKGAQPLHALVMIHLTHILNKNQELRIKNGVENAKTRSTHSDS